MQEEHLTERSFLHLEFLFILRSSAHLLRRLLTSSSSPCLFGDKLFNAKTFYVAQFQGEEETEELQEEEPVAAVRRKNERLSQALSEQY